jgi:hypothetical protein
MRFAEEEARTFPTWANHKIEILLKAAAQGRTGWNSIYHQQQQLGPATPPALGRRPLPFTQ